MLNPKYVFFVFEGENDALAVNLNNFCTISFDDAKKREILIDYGTTERVITLDDDKDFFSITKR